MTEKYDFKNATTSAKSLVHMLNMMGNNLVGVELGVAKGENLCMLAQNVKGVQQMYGIDSYQPHTEVDGTHYDEKAVEMDKAIAQHNIKWCAASEKIVFLTTDVDFAADQLFHDNSVDFVFIDCAHDAQSIKNVLHNWYPKIKDGGLITGHDWYSSDIRDGVSQFMVEANIVNDLYDYDDCFVIKK